MRNLFSDPDGDPLDGGQVDVVDVQRVAGCWGARLGDCGESKIR